MIVQAVRTRKVTPKGCTITELLDESLQDVPERSVVVVTSKVVSLCEGTVVPKEGTDLQQLIYDEAEWCAPDAEARHGYTINIAHDMLTLNSGIDESNADGNYVLWPLDPQASANHIRQYLVQRFGLQEVAVIIVDSSFLPMRWGAIGLALAYSGIEPVRSYHDTVDLFGRPLLLTRTNVVDSLATAATLVMGEGAEQTPLAVIGDIPNVAFVSRDPTPEEIKARRTPPQEDMFGDVLTAVEWRRGGAAPPEKSD